MWIKWTILLLSTQMFANYFAEEVPVQDEIAQKVAYIGKWFINKGGVTASVKKVVREPVPAGWKYTIIMDVTKYGSLATEECLVVGVYDVKTGDIWLSDPDPINPVHCTEVRR